MVKKIIYALLLLFVAQFSFAQSAFSEDDVIKYILVESGNGTSEQAITSKLLRDGYSIDVIKKALKEVKTLREKYNIVGGSENVLEDRSVRLRKLDAPSTESNDSLEDEDFDWATISEENIVYGRNIFNNKMLTFAPAMNIPTPTNYILGAGDQVIIDIWGASQETIDDYISPDGFLIVDKLGPIKLAGKSVKEADEFVKSRLSEIYNNSEVSLSVGTMRSINVQVVGDVATPGTYTVSALSTAFNALYAAGGINNIGTLRSISVYRNSKLYAEIDVYAFLFDGNSKGNVLLQDNDVISVGSYKSIVTIQGKVKRPMMYEMKENETLSKLFDYAGGFTNNAYTEKVSVVRKFGKEYSVHTLQKKDFNSFKLSDGDSIYVDSILPRFSNMVEIKGAVPFQGMYELGRDVKTFKQLIAAAGGLLEEAFVNRAVLQHRNFDNTIEAQSIDVKGILEGTSPDVELKNNDLVFIPSESAMRGKQTIYIGGEVNIPGTYAYAENMSIEDLILCAGGFTPSASISKIDVFRRFYDPTALQACDEITKVISLSVKDGLVIDNGESFVLQAYDEIFVRKSPVFNNKKVVTIKGCVNFEGNYAIRNNKYSLSDLINDAKGFTNAAYIKGARLYRKLTEEELYNVQQVLEREKVRMWEEFKDEQESLAMYDSIMKIKLSSQSVYLVAIDLEQVVKNPKGLEDILLKEGDMLVIPEYTGTVKISGEVFHPITMSYHKGENKKFYIKHAGGYANNAKKRGAYVVYMNGAVKKLSRKSKDIQPGCEIIVPTKGASKFTISDITSVATSTLSMAALVTSIVNTLNNQ